MGNIIDYGSQDTNATRIESITSINSGSIYVVNNVYANSNNKYAAINVGGTIMGYIGGIKVASTITTSNG